MSSRNQPTCSIINLCYSNLLLQSIGRVKRETKMDLTPKTPLMLSLPKLSLKYFNLLEGMHLAKNCPSVKRERDEFEMAVALGGHTPLAP